MKSITIYTDPSHGWAKVSLLELNSLSIMDKIRSYSRYTLGHNYINPFYKSDKPIEVNLT